MMEQMPLSPALQKTAWWSGQHVGEQGCYSERPRQDGEVGWQEPRADQQKQMHSPVAGIE